MSVWRAIGLIVQKDMLVELRTREVLASMVLFSTLIVVIFAFAFDLDADRAAMVTPGIVWVTVLFSGTLGLGRVFERERERDGITALFLSPPGPAAVYIAKVIGVLIFMVVAEVITLPLVFAFVGVTLPADGIGLFAAALALGILGFALVGTLFGAMLSDARLRDVLIPLVLYPVVVPILIAGVQLTGAALSGQPDPAAGAWLRLMIGYDLIFLVLSPWIFSRVMVD